MNSLTFCSRMIIITSISDKYAASAYNDMKCNNRITTCNKLIQPLYISYYPYEQTYKYVIDISSFDSVFNVCSYLNCALIYFLKIYNLYQTIVAIERIKSGFLWLWRNHSWNKNHRHIKIENNVSDWRKWTMQNNT